MRSMRGKLLIAAPVLVDPNFHRTVVILAAHDEAGAMGLVLNRPSETTVAEAIPELAYLAEADAPLQLGGPVAPESAIVLAEFTDTSLAAVTIFGNVGLPAAGSDMDELQAGVRRARVFAGHAGWGPGQLDAELAEEAWFIGELAPDELWHDPAHGLWSSTLQRLGGRYALIARMPQDPSVN